MALSDDDLIFLRENRGSRSNITLGIIVALLVLCVAIVFNRRRAPQPIRHTAPITARPTATAARADARKVLNELRELQIKREASLEKLKELVAAVEDMPSSRLAPFPTAASTPSSRPQHTQPAPVREKKILTRAAMDAEIARRAEQNARDKAEIDRLNAEREAEKQKRMRLKEEQDRKERIERLLQQRARIRRRIWHYRIPEKDKFQPRTH